MDHQSFAQLLGNYGEFVGAIAVVATLLYLAIQIRQNSKITEAQMFQARTQMSEERYGQIADSIYLAGIYSKLDTDRSRLDPSRVDQLTPEELLRLRLSEQRWLRGLDNVFHQHSLGFLPDDFLDEIKSLVRQRQPLWQRIETNPVRDSLNAFIESALEEKS